MTTTSAPGPHEALNCTFIKSSARQFGTHLAQVARNPFIHRTRSDLVSESALADTIDCGPGPLRERVDFGDPTLGKRILS